jgi:hypothetical protein
MAKSMVRRAGASRSPLIVTDRGEAVALLANLSLLKFRRKRNILPGYAAMMAQDRVMMFLMTWTPFEAIGDSL